MKEGDNLPPFRFLNQNGESIDLSDYIGKQGMVLFFYPKDNTPGCTREARGFQSRLQDFKKHQIAVFGISGDSPESHKEFCDNQKLEFPLLSDEGNRYRKLLKVPSTLLGFLPGRVSYVVDKKGKIRKIIKAHFDPQQHIDESLKAIEELAENGEV